MDGLRDVSVDGEEMSQLVNGVLEPTLSIPPSIKQQLLWARRGELDGKMVVKHNGNALGFIVFHRGRVAWAICHDQSETLGKFLQRIGRVTRDQLDRLICPSNERQLRDGRKKIGELLEEAGVIERPVLRRCLLLHTRRAMEKILAAPGAEAKVMSKTFVVDEKMTFPLEELMPLDPDVTGDKPALSTRWRTWNRENRFLEPLTAIAGYRASALIASDGELAASHAEAVELDPTVLAVYLAAALESATRAATTTSLGPVEFVLLDCAEGSLVARWLDETHRHLVVVLIDRDGRLGAAKYALKQALPQLRQGFRPGGS